MSVVPHSALCCSVHASEAQHPCLQAGLQGPSVHLPTSPPQVPPDCVREEVKCDEKSVVAWVLQTQNTIAVEDWREPHG